MIVNGNEYTSGEDIYKELLRQYKRKEGMVNRGKQWAADQGLDTNAKLPQNYFDISRSGVPEPQPGEPTVGYRYDRQDSEGNISSMYVDHVIHDRDTDTLTRNEKVRHDPTGLGFYYWLSSEVADAHSLGLIYRDLINEKEWSQKGDLVKHRIEGTATFNKFYDEGQTANDIYYTSDVLSRVTKQDYDAALLYYKNYVKG